jgi:hypothetical protein
VTARWRALKTARTTPERVSLGRSTSRSCIALLSSVREILLAQWERPSTPIQTERVEIAHLAIFERRPFGRHRENRLLLPVHDLPLMLLLGDPGADRIEYQSAEPGA